MRLNTLHSYYTNRSPGKTLLASPRTPILTTRKFKKSQIIYSSTELITLSTIADH